MRIKRVLIVVALWVAFCALAGCTGTTKGRDQVTRYEVNQLAKPMALDANWDKPVWQAVTPLELTHYMGDRPAHLPKVQAKLLYDDQAVYVIFRVEDQYVRSVAKQHQDMVCRDSCAEFFFAPGTDVAKGYFNLEMNSGGIMLLHFQTIPRKNQRSLAPAEVERIEIAHTLPKIVDPEITEPTTWAVEYRVPLDILPKYYPEWKKPAPGVTWRANFFKCADATSHPHWLTWASIDRPKPDFHVPEFFGTLEFK